MDVRGDAYGLLAAHPMTPLVSLHHLDYIKPLLPKRTKYESLNTLIKTYRLDPPRTMQQSFCFYNRWWHKWSMSVSWGYTVQIYPSLLTANELEMPLQTGQGGNAVRSVAGSIIVWKYGLEVVKMKTLLLVK
ncbi:uncharacterized protein Tco_0662639, partial [Tanacetum coccineum]